MIVKNCFKCDISASRKLIVNGEGDKDCRFMIIGEAPGYHEDKYGRPFIGKAGQKMNEFISATGLKRDWFYIVNIIRCKPFGNDKPTDTNIDNCLPYLMQDIIEVNPKLIICAGTYSFSTIMNMYMPVSKYRGRLYLRGKKLVFPIYHPAYILRNEEEDARYLKDWQMIAKLYKLFVNKRFNPII